MQFIKKNLITLLLTLSLIALAGYGFYLTQRISLMVSVIDNQAKEIIAQGAAWQTLLGSFKEEDQKNFINSVNQLLGAKK